MNKISKLLIILIIFCLAGCSYYGGGRYSMRQDKAPSRPVDVSHVPNAIPKVEPKSRGGNKSPYTVFGKRYYVMPSALGYQEAGTASWYGKKFHGHKTSNGEVYDMYKMSAAHKSLPLPSYVWVTNLANNKRVIVRVNDRGPFHGKRLIDLSYAAASKLGMLKQGTARVHIEAIDPRAWQRPSSITNTYTPQTHTNVVGRFLQVGAYSSYASALEVERHLRRMFSQLTVATKAGQRSNGQSIYRVQLGPISSSEFLLKLKNELQRLGYFNPRLVN